MRVRFAWAFPALLVAALPAAAQQGELVEPAEPVDPVGGEEAPPAADRLVQLRVSALRADGVVAIDRGMSDGLAVRDVVRFEPRSGGTLVGDVVRVEDKSALVLLRDVERVPEPGTPGAVRVPEARFRLDERPEPEGELPEKPPWAMEETPWPEDMPLLAEVGAVRPEDRASYLTGRAYLIVDQTWAAPERNDAFYRAGLDLSMVNPFGHGGTLHTDFEGNYRRVEVPDRSTQRNTRLRLDRFSYARGGTRFDELGWEVGRFLQSGMPEFGVIDGGELSVRREGGDRYGISLGFLPEPDRDYETGEDLALAAWYRWALRPDDSLGLWTGVQSSWHNGNRDRDLFVGKLEYLPDAGWDFQGTLWVDYYDDSDDIKEQAVELTQAYLRSSKRWDAGHRLEVSYRRQLFPELLRDEFLDPVTAAEILDNRYDRLTFGGVRALSHDRRLEGRLGLWDDEDESGVDGEIELEADDLFFARDRGSLALFATRGQFTTLYGTRLDFHLDEGGRGWDLSYEFAYADQGDFDEGTILQHRLRAGGALYAARGWSLSFFTELLTWEGDDSLSIGLYLQETL